MKKRDLGIDSRARLSLTTSTVYVAYVSGYILLASCNHPFTRCTAKCTLCWLTIKWASHHLRTLRMAVSVPFPRCPFGKCLGSVDHRKASRTGGGHFMPHEYGSPGSPCSTTARTPSKADTPATVFSGTRAVGAPFFRLHWTGTGRPSVRNTRRLPVQPRWPP